MTSRRPLSPAAAAFFFEPPDYIRRLEKAEVFANVEAPLEVEIGSGDGSFLVELATLHPERNFLGLERLLGRATKTARKAHRAGLSNLKVLRIDGAYAITHLLPAQRISRIHLLFPDPWPKKKQHKHRLVQPAFCAAIHHLLEPEGEWLFKTDHEGYFEDALATISASRLFQAVDWPKDAFPYPQTDFERQWLAEGRRIQAARWRRLG